MWGGVVESDTSASSAAAWGAAGSTGSDPTATWMGSTGGGQTGWGGGGGAPAATKSSWDAQQQQNLVTAAGGGQQSTGNSWQTASNGVAPVNGWTGANSGGQTNWNTGSGQQQQQWTGTSPGGGSTWAGVAGRHASTSAAAPTPVQGSISGNGPVVTTPTSAAVRPKFDPNTPTGWGKPIDQGTPWEVRQAAEAAAAAAAAANASSFGGAPAATATTPTNWSNTGGGGASWNGGSGTQHSNPSGNINRDWQNQSSDRDATPTYGGYGGGAKPVRGMSTGGGRTDTQQWEGQSSGWDKSIPHIDRQHSSGGNTWGNESNQQREPAANVWTGPPAPADVADSHMIWTNPFPKKTAQPDKGTTTWGDPTSQGDIKRWKTNNEGDLLPALTVLSTSTPSNAQVGSGNGNSGTTQTQQPASASGTSAWKDSSTTPTPQQQAPNVPSWTGATENVGQNSVSSPTTGGGGWGDQTTIQTGSTTTKSSTPYDRDGITTAGWGAGGKPAEATRNSVESDGGNASDDVFSTPTTPMSAGAGPPGQPGSTLILNKQQPQLPNGFGPHGGSGNNANLNQLVSQMTSKLNIQNGQTQNLAFNANATLPGGTRAPQQQLLTQQIADQLKAAVRAGLIDIGILHQPLPQETLLRLNQLLQLVPKLDQAQKEQLLLQTQASKQPNGLNAAQQAELQRVTNEVNKLRQSMAQLKQAINAQTQNAAGNAQPQMRNGPNPAGAAGATGDGGQSKLEQWKRGSTNGVINGNDGNGVFGVGLSGSSNDPWSNTPAKRNSGTDWPQSPATTPGDMPKSPDRQCEANKENEHLQPIMENTNRMPTPERGSGNDTSGSAGTGGLTTPTLLDDVPEFKPGQPWNWRDPKELAEDPDATPGSVKRPALSSVSSVMNPSDFFGGATSPSGGQYGGSGPDMMNAAALAAGINAMNFGAGNAAMMGGGYPNYGNMTSNYYGQNPSKGPSGFGGQQHGGLGDSWPSGPGGMQRASRPPSQMGQPIGGRAPFKHSMSTPSTTGTGFMSPYGMGATEPAQWVVLTNLNMMDEGMLNMVMARVAPVANCIYPPGAGFAVVKFKDVSLDKVLPRLQQECSAVGVTIQLAKHEEVSRLIQAVTGQRGGGPPGGPQGAGGGHLFGPPPPPPHHHPAAMGPAIWDAPPPQVGGPWGPPPPPQGAGLHHHGAGGPFAPHPAAAMADPTVAAAAAMSMAMPPGMHDGLFAPVGHDRHAPPF